MFGECVRITERESARDGESKLGSGWRLKKELAKEGKRVMKSDEEEVEDVEDDSN